MCGSPLVTSKSSRLRAPALTSSTARLNAVSWVLEGALKLEAFLMNWSEAAHLLILSGRVEVKQGLMFRHTEFSSGSCLIQVGLANSVRRWATVKCLLKRQESLASSSFPIDIPEFPSSALYTKPQLFRVARAIAARRRPPPSAVRAEKVSLRSRIPPTRLTSGTR